MTDMEKQLTDFGFIEIDYEKPLNDQIEIGDILISTEMYMFDTASRGTIIDQKYWNKFVDKIGTFIVLGVDDRIIQMIADDKDEDEGWFEPEGRIFVKKNKIEYVTMQIPTFLVDKVLAIGGKK